MKSKTIYQPVPIDMTTVFIESDIEWGNEKETNIKFETEKDIIIQSHNGAFNWAIGTSIKVVEEYIEQKETSQNNYIKEIKENFLTKQQKDILFYEEEKKKRRAWEESHWSETEGGDGYFH